MMAQLCSQLPHPPPDVIHGRAKCSSRNEKHGKQKWDVRLPPIAPPARPLRGSCGSGRIVCGQSPCEADPSLTVTLADIPSWAAPYARGEKKWPFAQISDDDAPYYWAQASSS